MRKRARERDERKEKERERDVNHETDSITTYCSFVSQPLGGLTVLACGTF